AIRPAIAVLNALQIAIGGPQPFAFVGLCGVDTVIVLLRVVVDYGVPLVVVALTDEPTENARGMSRQVGRVKDARIVVFTVECGDIVLADRAPMNLAGSDVSPALDSGEQALDAGAVAMDYISRFSGVVFKSRSVRLENRNQVLGTRKNVDVR